MPRNKMVDQRSESTKKRLEMYSQRPKRNSRGEILFQEYQSKDKSHQARIQPDRRWFGPTRTVQQHDLQQFREQLEKQRQDPNVYILKQAKVPMSLLRDSQKEARANILGVETFKDTFGAKSKRKRPKLAVNDVEELAKHVVSKSDEYKEEADNNIKKELDWRPSKREAVYYKGTSHRIWGELHKVLDSSDVIIEVLDARDPMGTRAFHVEEHVKKNMPHKHILLLLNKADLVPTWALKRWLHVLSKEFPVLAFHASLQKPFGKGSLIQVLRQFQHLHSDKQQISVGFIGYPNVGKSSVINTLKSEKVCPVAPVPGETKVWRYITLFKKIFLVDCPGVVYPSGDSDSDIVLKGVVRVENLAEPIEHVPALMARVRREHLAKTYGVESWVDHTDFVEQFARKSGRLLKGGEPDVNTIAKMMLNDWLRGKIPFFTPPPDTPDFDDSKKQQAEQKRAEQEAKDALHPRKQSLKALNVRDEFKNEGGDVDDDEDAVLSDDDEDLSEDLASDHEMHSFDLSDLDAAEADKAQGGDEEEDDDDEDDDNDEDEAVDWDTVFSAAKTGRPAAAAAASSSSSASSQSQNKAQAQAKKQKKGTQPASQDKKAKKAKSFGESIAAEMAALEKGTRNSKKRKRGTGADSKGAKKDGSGAPDFEVVPVGFSKHRRPARNTAADDSE